MMTQKDFFNSMAEVWDTAYYHNTDKIKYILNLLNTKRGSKILDVGTGTGILVPFLSEEVGIQGEITAIDFSYKMIEVAQRKYAYKNVSFICDDVFGVDFPNEYFDFIICYSVFPHFEDKQSAINILSKYLKDGGKLAIFHSQSREAINNLHKKITEVVVEDNLPTIDVIKGYFKNSNLKTISEIDNGEMFVIIARKMNRLI